MFLRGWTPSPKCSCYALFNAVVCCCCRYPNRKVGCLLLWPKLVQKFQPNPREWNKFPTRLFWKDSTWCSYSTWHTACGNICGLFRKFSNQIHKYVRIRKTFVAKVPVKCFFWKHHWIPTRICHSDLAWKPNAHLSWIYHLNQRLLGNEMNLNQINHFW